MMPLFADRTFQIDTENAFKMGPHISGLEQSGNDVVKLNLGEPDFGVPNCVKEVIKRELDRDNTHYCDPKGILPLREAIAEQMHETRGLNVSPDQVVVFPGAKPGIGFTQQIYCNPGDEIIYPSPGFPIFESFIQYVGAVPVPLHLKEENGFAFTPDELEELITPKTRLIILNFPSNPTGGVATREQLEGIAEVIQRKCSPETRVYSDEIYEYILFDGEKHNSIASIPGMESRTIVSSGFSKSFAWTGGRIGYVVTPTVEEAEVFKNLNINYFSCVAPYNQMGAREAFVNPEARAATQGMVATFQERRNVIVQQVNAIDGMSCRTPSGAFYLFPNIAGVCENLGVIDHYKQLPKETQATTSPSTLFQMFALYRHGVAVMDRRSFGKIGADDEHYLRLSIAANLCNLEEGVNRLSAAASDTAGFAAFMQQERVLC